MAQKASSPAHTKRMRRYRIVPCPKHGRKAICSRCREDLGTILRQPCRWKGVEMIEGHLAPDHVHMLAGIPPRIGVSGFMGCLKGKSSLLMSGKACEPQVQVREQEAADIALGKLGVKEYEDPFSRKQAGTCPFGGLATSQAAIGPERSEGQGLEALAGIHRVMPSGQTTRYTGGHDFMACCGS